MSSPHPVIARSTCDEAIQTLLRGLLDSFVTEFIIGPAKGRTRWLLAMTTETAATICPELSSEPADVAIAPSR
jgi:hypothetical protein